MPSKFPAAFLACGEPFLTEVYWNSLLSEAQSKKPQTVAQVFHAGDCDLDGLLAQARSLPFLAESQLFRIKEAEKIKKVEALERYLKKPFEHTVLFFEAVTAAKDHPLVKLIQQKGEVRFFEVSQENRASGSAFIRQKLQNAKKKLGPGAAEKLEQMAEFSPSFLDSFLEKLIVYSENQNEITEEMVEVFHEKAQETDTFQLSNALLAGKTGLSLIVLKKLLSEDEKELIPLLGFLHWQLRRLWVARVLLDEGVPEGEILRRIKVYSKQAPFFIRQYKQFKKERLESALEGLFQLDWQVKTGQVDGALGLELWILDFHRGMAPAARF